MIAIFAALGALALGLIGVRQGRYVALPGRGNAQLLMLFVVLPVFLFAIAFVGFRPQDAGFDTFIYLSAYQNLDGPSTAIETGQRYFGNAELLWWPLQSLLRPALGAQEWLVANFVAVFLSVFVLYAVLGKEYQLNAMIFGLVFLTYFSVYAGNAMRQALAFPIGAAGFCMVVGRKKRGWTLICLSIGFHWSALVFLVAPIFSLRLFQRDVVYLSLPAVGAAASMFLGGLVERIVALLGSEALGSKYDLYFASSHVSHVGEVWRTSNFWLCIATVYGFFLVCRPSKTSSKSLHAIALVAAFLVTFGLRVPDFSERYLPLLLLLLPAMAALMIRGLRIVPEMKNALLLLGFVALGVAVFLSESAQITLGYTVA